MKSIKAKIIALILPIVIILSLLLGITSCFLNYRTAITLLDQNLAETAIVAADQVAAEIKSIQNVAIQTGCTARIANSTGSVDEKKALIDQTAKKYGFQRGNVLQTDGTSIFDGNNYAERDYFKAAINGSTYISDPTISKITGKLSFLISAPLWENGIPDTKIVGVVYFAPDENFLNNIVSNINVSKTGTAYMINKKGTNVADADASLVSVDNHIEEAKTDSSVANIAAIHEKMIAGEEGFDKYSHEGADWVIGYAPITNTDGWSIGVIAQQNDFMGNFYISLYTTIAIVILFVILGIIIATYFGNKIGNPIKKCVKRLETMSKGDLETAVPIVTSRDETGILSNALVTLRDGLAEVVYDVSDTLTKMSNGDFAVSDVKNYEGDFLPLTIATNKIIDSMNEALLQINISSDQVSAGSEQVSSGAQALSQGATEQASSIQELSASIEEISEHIKKNAENAKHANALSLSAGKRLADGNDEMKQMLLAMNEISDSSNKISNIIKTINDIAFQTNILALNAAVEAARAGVAGKGFAVVADEVRNLASKSASAAKETTELISGSITAVKNGTHIADDTANTLIEVMSKAKESTDIVAVIASASDEQANAVAQVTLGIEQISAVVQTNSATAEESAAASEELSGQANMLKDLVARFELRSN